MTRNATAPLSASQKRRRQRQRRQVRDERAGDFVREMDRMRREQKEKATNTGNDGAPSTTGSAGRNNAGDSSQAHNDFERKLERMEAPPRTLQDFLAQAKEEEAARKRNDHHAHPELPDEDDDDDDLDAYFEAQMNIKFEEQDRKRVFGAEQAAAWQADEEAALQARYSGNDAPAPDTLLPLRGGGHMPLKQFHRGLDECADMFALQKLERLKAIDAARAKHDDASLAEAGAKYHASLAEAGAKYDASLAEAGDKPSSVSSEPTKEQAPVPATSAPLISDEDFHAQWAACCALAKKLASFNRLDLTHLMPGTLCRKEYRDTDAYAIPDEATIRAIIEFAGNNLILEVGAGGGFWTYLINRWGGKCLATDNGAWDKFIRKCYAKVLPMSAEAALAEFTADKGYNTLLLIWPPPPSYDDADEQHMAFNALRAFKGNQFVFIGEGRGGNTGTDAFFDELEAHWTRVPTPSSCQFQQMFDSWDDVFFYRRKGTASG